MIKKLLLILIPILFISCGYDLKVDLDSRNEFNAYVLQSNSTFNKITHIKADIYRQKFPKSDFIWIYVGDTMAIIIPKEDLRYLLRE